MDDAQAFYAAPTAMTRLPDHGLLEDRPTDLDGMRRAVQGMLMHRDWAAAYGIDDGDIRTAEQHLRSTGEILDRAFELSDRPITEPRPPIDRVLCICRHFTLLHTALLRAEGVAARVRCGFSNYFDREKWYDHWITERWDGARWVRDDPQIDDLQAEIAPIDFDPHDQPTGQFLSGSEAWAATRSGDLDPTVFGIFDMWGASFIAGNVVADLSCLNKVELLPWDAWGMLLEWGPHDPVPDAAADELDELAAIVNVDDHRSIRGRYESDDRLRVPPEILSFVDGEAVAVTLPT